MNKLYRKTLIATAIAALMSAPAWSDSHMTDTDMDDGMGEPHSQDDGLEVDEDQWETESQDDGLEVDDDQWETESDAQGGDAASESLLYSFTPDYLDGMEVIGPDGETIGRIQSIVRSMDHDEVFAVISSGGFLGIGARDILVPLDELTDTNDMALRANFTRDTVEERPRYDSEGYEELDPDRPISESSMER